MSNKVNAFSSSTVHQAHLAQLQKLFPRKEQDKVRVVNLVNERPSLSRSAFTVPSATDIKTSSSAVTLFQAPLTLQSAEYVRMDLPKTRVNFWIKPSMVKKEAPAEAPVVVSKEQQERLDKLKNFHLNFLGGLMGNIRRPSEEQRTAPQVEAPPAQEPSPTHKSAESTKAAETPKAKAPLKSILSTGPKKEKGKVKFFDGEEGSPVNEVWHMKRHVVPKYGNAYKSEPHPLRAGMSFKDMEEADARIGKLWTAGSDADLKAKGAQMRKEDPETASDVEHNESYAEHIRASTVEIEGPHNDAVNAIEKNMRMSKPAKRKKIEELEEARVEKRDAYRIPKYVSDLEKYAYKQAVSHAKAMQVYYNAEA